MKTLLCAVLALTLCTVLLLTGCGNGDKNKTTTAARTTAAAGTTEGMLNAEDGKITDASDNNGLLGEGLTDVSRAAEDIITDAGRAAEDAVTDVSKALS